jgi:hypothetical protein
MHASTSPRSTTVSLIAILALGGLAYLITTYLQRADDDALDLSVTIPDPPAEQLSHQASRPPRHIIHYKLGAAFGWWHDHDYGSLELVADLDLDRGELVTADPDGEHHRVLPAAQVDMFHNLATWTFRLDWNQRDMCTDVSYRLDIVDGDSCELHVHGTCASHEELIAALHAVAWPRGSD